MASTTGTPVWISTTQPRSLYISYSGRQNLIEMRDSTFARFGEKAIDFWNGLAQDDGRIDPKYNCGDGVHLNNAGHRILFERVVEKAILDAITRVSKPKQNTPQTFKLYSNYPNPFNPATTIDFELPNPCYVELTIYNIMGQFIRKLIAEEYVSGIHSVIWDGGDDLGIKASSGIYFYIIRAGDFTASKKLILTR